MCTEREFSGLKSICILMCDACEYCLSNNFKIGQFFPLIMPLCGYTFQLPFGIPKQIEITINLIGSSPSLFFPLLSSMPSGERGAAWRSVTLFVALKKVHRTNDIYRNVFSVYSAACHILLEP